MQISAIGCQPYVYNTNTISANSMKPISSIPNDATAGKVDYSNLVAEGETTNSLKPGQSKNFVDIIASQMAMGQANAARILQPAEEAPQTNAEDIANVGTGLADTTGQAAIASVQ